jgi:acetylornithine deacetylase/succinyl-diaminopimelate desuccinylase-like protein
MCILGEPTEQKVVLGHYGTMWARISTQGPFIHTAFSQGRLGENAIVRMQGVLEDVLAWIPGWERRSAYGGIDGVVNVGAIRAGQPWRVSRTPNRADLFLDIRVPPTMAMTEARAEFGALVRKLRERFPDYGITSEVFVTVPGAQIDEGHPLIAAIDAGHAKVFGDPPARDTVRWFSDASALTRYGIETVNYGTSSGLPDPDGENLAIAGLRDIAKVYAQAAAEICELAA